MENQILQDLQLFGVDESVTAKEMQTRWRHLSSHTHPDRYKKGTPEFEEALAKQVRLNCAKDRLSAYIALRDAEERARAHAHAEAESQTAEQRQQESQGTASTPEMESEYIYSNPVFMQTPPIRTNETYSTEKETAEDEVTLTVSRTMVHDLLTAGMFLGSVFAGAVVAALVSAALPGIATSAPIILLAVMLTTMGGVLLKMKEWCEPKQENLCAQGKGVAGDAK